MLRDIRSGTNSTNEGARRSLSTVRRAVLVAFEVFVSLVIRSVFGAFDMPERAIASGRDKLRTRSAELGKAFSCKSVTLERLWRDANILEFTHVLLEQEVLEVANCVVVYSLPQTCSSCSVLLISGLLGADRNGERDVHGVSPRAKRCRCLRTPLAQCYIP